LSAAAMSSGVRPRASAIALASADNPADCDAPSSALSLQLTKLSTAMTVTTISKIVDGRLRNLYSFTVASPSTLFIEQNDPNHAADTLTNRDSVVEMRRIVFALAQPCEILNELGVGEWS
jgi:hypothetical protein